LTKSDDIYECLVCGACFSRSGEIQMFKEADVPKGKKWDRSKGVPPKSS
jgi:hypothetical protein